MTRTERNNLPKDKREDKFVFFKTILPLCKLNVKSFYIKDPFTTCKF
jgi:hypothetical protein